MKKYIRMVAIIIITMIISIEAGLRIFYYEQLKKRKFPTIYLPDTLHGYTIKPNSTGEIVYPSQNNSFKLNNHGFIGNDFNLEKPDSVFRIIHVGTSQEANYGIKNKANYNYKIQEIFDSLGYHVEFINMSIDGGHRSLLNFNLIKDRYLKYNPDLILFTNIIPLEAFYYSREVYKDYVISYAMGNQKSKERAENIINQIENRKFFTTIYDFSFICRAICKKYIENADFDVNGINNTWQIKTYMDNSLKLSGYHCLFVRQSLDKTANEFLNLKSCFLPDQDIMLINYFDTIENYGYLKHLNIFTENSGINSIVINVNQDDYSQLLTYEHDGHPSEFMHQIIANKMFVELDKIIPEQFK